MASATRTPNISFAFDALVFKWLLIVHHTLLCLAVLGIELLFGQIGNILFHLSCVLIGIIKNLFAEQWSCDDD